MKKYLEFIKELFNTKNYKWISNSDTQKIASFKIIETYYINFDTIGDKAYNIYFYFNDLTNKPIYNLVNNIDKSSYKILSNVKNCIIEFINNNEVNFIGYSSYENERDSLYFLMLQLLSGYGDFDYSTKIVGRKKYYFLYKKDIAMESHLYIKRMMENDNKKKKDL